MSWFARHPKAAGRLALAFGTDTIAYAVGSTDGAATVRRAGVLQRGDDTPEQFQRRLRELKGGAGEVIAVLDLPQYQLLQIEAPAVPPAELRAAARWRIKDLVDAHLDDLTLDVLRVGDDRPRAQQQLFVIAAQNPAIASAAAACSDAGLPLAVIDVRETVQRNLQTALAERAGIDGQASAALVVEGRQALLTVSANGELFYTRRLAWDDTLLAAPSVAGHPLRNDESAYADGADDWSSGHDSSPALVIELQRSVDVWERSWPNLPLAALFVFAGARTDALVERLEPELALPVRPMRIESVFDGLAELPAEAHDACLPVLGALLRAADTNPQQINLHTPVLMKQRALFSAQAMAAALAVFVIGVAALGLWLAHATQAARGELDATGRGLETERAQLNAALAARPVQTLQALRDELQQLQAELKRQRERLAELRSGLLESGRGNAALLRLLAQSLPEPAWITEVRVAEGRIELGGETLDPAVLRPWIERLDAEPLFAGRPLAALRVEQRKGEPGLAERWGFTLVNGTPARASLASAAPAGESR